MAAVKSLNFKDKKQFFISCSPLEANSKVIREHMFPATQASVSNVVRPRSLLHVAVLHERLVEMHGCHRQPLQPITSKREKSVSLAFLLLAMTTGDRDKRKLAASANQACRRIRNSGSTPGSVYSWFCELTHKAGIILPLSLRLSKKIPLVTESAHRRETKPQYVS